MVGELNRMEAIMCSKTLILTAVVLLAGAAPAQIVDPGLAWVSVTQQAFVGTSCGGFTCAPFTINVSTGEEIQVQVRGYPGTIWALGISASATQCLPIPGVTHELVLDFPITVVLSGVFMNPDLIMACPGGLASIGFFFPFMPPGTAFSIQAIAEIPGLTPALTSAITVTVV
jgi:hypothetical protein